jgi:hypothetical protein
VTGFIFDKKGGQMNAMAIVKVNDEYPKIGVYGLRMLPNQVGLDTMKFYLMDDL